MFYVSELMEAIIEDENNQTTFVRDKEDHYEIQVLAPGYKKSEVEISVEKEVLYIKTKEERFGAKPFTFYTPLHNKLDDENIKAKLENGVLTITVPKLEQPKGVTFVEVE